MRFASFLFVLAFLSGCTSFVLLEPGRVSVDDVYTFDVSQKWSKASQQHHHILTLDGPALQTVHITTGVKDKQTLLYDLSEEPQPPYDKKMSLLEMQDFIRDSFIAIGAERFEITSFTPKDFAAWPGFSVSFSYLTTNGLEVRGMMVGAQHNEKLYTVTYRAPALHYYDKNLADFEAIVRSIQRIAPPTS